MRPYLAFIQLKTMTGEWGAIQILPVPCSHTYRGCTVLDLNVSNLFKIRSVLIDKCNIMMNNRLGFTLESYNPIVWV